MSERVTPESIARLRDALQKAPPESWGSADYESAAVILCLRAEEADALNEARYALPSLLDEIERLRREKKEMVDGWRDGVRGRTRGPDA